MNYDTAVNLTSKLLAFAMLLQGIEMVLITRRKSFFEIWSYENIKDELQKGLPFPEAFLKLLFSNRSLVVMSVIQILAASFGLFIMSPLVPAILFTSHLMVCIRFRGTFNGGSDMMIFVLLSGLLISFLSTKPFAQKLGLIYIAIHGLYSYFKAGLAKVVNPEWRRGFALGVLLERSVYKDVRTFAQVLQSKKTLQLILCWSVLIFELAAILLPFVHGLTIYYFLTAAAFHFIIYLSLGLNRFFWVWMAAWPSLFYCFSIIALLD